MASTRLDPRVHKRGLCNFRVLSTTRNVAGDSVGEPLVAASCGLHRPTRLDESDKRMNRTDTLGIAVRRSAAKNRTPSLAVDRC